MTGRTLTAAYPAGVVLTNPTDNPVTIATGSSIAATSGGALSGVVGTDWTITNAGSVTQTGTASGAGIALGSGGTVTNQAGGAVAGYNFGVTIAGAGTVLNQGTISSKQTTGASYSYTLASKSFVALTAGVAVGGGSVTNASLGSITGTFQGVALAGGASLTNAGFIGATNTSAGFGVVLTEGGTVTDTTTGTISGGRYGVLSIGKVASTVVNQGQITSPRIAVELFTGGSVSNASQGTISGGVYGVNALGSIATTVSNQGAISGQKYAGIYLRSGGSVTNAAGASITGGFDGIAAAGTVASTVTNAGAITGTTGNGVLLSKGGSVTNAATGTIAGVSYGVHVARVAGSVLNLGSISSTKVFTGVAGFDAAGVNLAVGGTVTNAASGNITAKWIGVQIGAQGASNGGTLVNRGNIFASDGTNGAGVWLHGAGVIDNEAGGTIAGGPFAVVSYYQTTLINRGTITGTAFAFDPVNAGFANRVIVAPGASFTGTVSGGNTLGSTIVSTLELESATSSGTITGFGTQFIKFGQVVVDAGASWSLGGTVAASQTVDLAGSGASLTLLNPVAMAGTISGFDATDTIALGGITDVTGVTLSAGNVLTITESAGPGLTLHFNPAQSFAGLPFHTAVAGSATSLSLACFAAGTRIETASGPVPVEELQPGMSVRSHFGGTCEVVWVGHRAVDCTRHPSPEMVWPIRVAANAFGKGQPERDLFLSPDHAVYVRDVLIPVHLLVNGSTIRQVPRASVTYYHVELTQHDVLLAEGLPAESYLDVGDRGDFANGGIAISLFPAFSRARLDLTSIWEAHGCAPLVQRGPVLEAVRKALNDRSDVRLEPGRQSGRGPG